MTLPAEATISAPARAGSTRRASRCCEIRSASPATSTTTSSSVSSASACRCRRPPGSSTVATEDDEPGHRRPRRDDPTDPFRDHQPRPASDGRRRVTSHPTPRRLRRSGTRAGFEPIVRLHGPIDSAVGPQHADDLISVIREALSNSRTPRGSDRDDGRRVRPPGPGDGDDRRQRPRIGRHLTAWRSWHREHGGRRHGAAAATSWSKPDSSARTSRSPAHPPRRRLIELPTSAGTIHTRSPVRQ